MLHLLLFLDRFTTTLQNILKKLTDLEHAVSKISPISDLQQQTEEISINITKLKGMNEKEVSIIYKIT